LDKIDDFHLKYSIPKENSKKNISGETVEKDEFGSLVPPRALFFSLPYLVRSISIRLNDYAPF